MVKSLPAMRETLVRFLGQEDPWRRKWLPTPVFLPGESHGQRSLAGYSPWGRKQSNTNERLTTFTFTGERSCDPKLPQGRKLSPCLLRRPDSGVIES